MGVWVATFYAGSQPYTRTSKLKSHTLVSDFILIERGTRQGCPLSPLLFALAIEPLALLIRCNPNIHGLELGSYKTQTKPICGLCSILANLALNYCSLTFWPPSQNLSANRAYR